MKYKYYVLTDIEDPYENCLDYGSSFDTEEEAEKVADVLKARISDVTKKPYYSSVTVVKKIKF